MRRLLLAALFLLPITAMADSYPAYMYYMWGSWTTQQAACDAYYGTNPEYIPIPDTQCKNPTTGAVYGPGFTKQTLHTCQYGGGTMSSDGTYTCLNATACPTGVSRDATGACTHTILTCQAGVTYDDGVHTTCQSIPDCNAGISTGGNFFDLSSKSCKTATNKGICISSVNTTYCPPIDDCKPAGYICVNDSMVVQQATQTRQLQIDASNALAIAKKAQLDQMTQAAETAAAQQQNDALTKQQSVSDAANALAAAKASGDQNAISQAIKAYSDALNAAADSQARSINKAAAKTKIEGIDTSAGTEQAAIPTSNPGNASAHETNIENMIPGATTALQDALSGDGNGTGRGTGIATSSTPSIDTSSLSKDSTLQSIGTKLDGISGKLGGTAATSTNDGKGRFYTSTGDTVSSVTATFMTTAKNSPILKAGQDVFNVSFPTMSSCSSCDFSIPSVMGMDAITSQPFCADWMGAFWTFISSALHIATIYLAARWIVTSAA